MLNDGVISTTQLGNSLAGAISSIYIPSGKTFRARDRYNQSQNFTSSISNLRVYGWDNRISHCIISGEDAGGNQNNNDVITLYTGFNYSGETVKISDGRINYLGPNAEGAISSISLPQGVKLVVFSERDMKGHYRTITASTRNLNSIGWNDRIKSVFVIRD